MWEGEDHTVIPLMLNILNSDAPPQVRASAASALGKYALLAQEDKILPKDAQLVQEALMRSLQDDSDTVEVRRRSLEAVSPFNTPRIQEHIRWAYGSGEQLLRRSSSTPRARPGKPGSRIISELRSPNPSLRYEGRLSFSELGERRKCTTSSLLEDDDSKCSGRVAPWATSGSLASGPHAACAMPTTSSRGVQEALEEIDVGD